MLQRIFRNLPILYSTKARHEELTAPFSPLTLSSIGLSTAYTLHTLANIATVLSCLHQEYSVRLTQEENEVLNSSHEFLKESIHQSLSLLSAHTSTEQFTAQELIYETLSILKHLPGYYRVRKHTDCDQNWKLTGSSLVFQQILMNVFHNALKATLLSSDPYILLTFEKKGTTTLLTITNAQPDPAHLEKLKGYGLGLPFVRDAMEKEFHGTVSLKKTSTEFSVILGFPASRSSTSDFVSRCLQ